VLYIGNQWHEEIYVNMPTFNGNSNQLYTHNSKLQKQSANILTTIWTKFPTSNSRLQQEIEQMLSAIQTTFNTYNSSLQQEAFPHNSPPSNRNHYLIVINKMQYIIILYVTTHYLKKKAMTNTVHWISYSATNITFK